MWTGETFFKQQTSKSSKLIDFNFRFLHRRLPTNSYLQKIGVREDGKCTFCRDEKEDLTHLFWKCQKDKNHVSALYATAQLSAGHSYVNLRLWPTTAGCWSKSGHSSCKRIVFQRRSLSGFPSELELVRGKIVTFLTLSDHTIMCTINEGWDG